MSADQNQRTELLRQATKNGPVSSRSSRFSLRSLGNAAGFAAIIIVTIVIDRRERATASKDGSISPPAAMASITTATPKEWTEAFQLFNDKRYTDAVPKLDHLIAQTQDKTFRGLLFKARALAKLGSPGSNWSPSFLDDLESAAQLDPKSYDSISFATTMYWLKLVGAISKSGVDANDGRPRAPKWAEAATAIRLLDQSSVDGEAIKGAMILAAVCDRHAASDERDESGDTLLRLLAGTLRGNPLDAAANEIDRSADLAEANKKDLRSIGEIESSLRRRYPKWWFLVDGVNSNGQQRQQQFFP